MKFIWITLAFLPFFSATAQAEVIDADDGGALAIFGTACEEFKTNEQNASTRIKATDKACFAAVSSLPEIVNIKDSFDDHDFNVMVYNIVDEYIEDMIAKTVEQNDKKICIEVSGFITPENIGKAIDQTIQTDEKDAKIADRKDSKDIEDIEYPENPEDIEDSEEDQISILAADNDPQSDTFIELPTPDENQHVVLINTVYVRPTEFYNNTQSSSHSHILENILRQSDLIQIVDNEDDATFIITPKVLKAKIEPINSETSRMQMVIALETFDKNKNDTTTEHQNKFVLFNNEDDEQSIAKNLLKQLFEQGSQPLISLAAQSSKKTFLQQAQPVGLISSAAKAPV